MAGSLRRKKRAKAAAGKKTQKVGVTTNFQTGRARVDHAVVSLPGAPRATEPWNVDATLTRNYAASGLASDANVAGRGGRNAMDDPGGVGARGGGDAGDVERGRDARAAGRDENERVLGAEAVDAETNARGGGAGESARR